MDREVWRWVVGYEGRYMVSNMGKVVSVPCVQKRGSKSYHKPGITVADNDNGHGYRVLSLYSDGVQKQVTVHRLVATAFIPNPDNLPEVNHIDGNKQNNCVSNLEWVTRRQNIKHAVDVLDSFSFNRHFTEEQVESIRTDKRTEKEIAEEYGVTQTTINAIRTGKTYKTYKGKTIRAGRTRQRKLSMDDVRKIRSSTKSGKELADIYGVAASTICKIRKGKRYKEDSSD